MIEEYFSTTSEQTTWGESSKVVVVTRITYRCEIVNMLQQSVRTGQCFINV